MSKSPMKEYDYIEGTKVIDGLCKHLGGACAPGSDIHAVVADTLIRMGRDKAKKFEDFLRCTSDRLDSTMARISELEDELGVRHSDDSPEALEERFGGKENIQATLRSSKAELAAEDRTVETVAGSSLQPR